ncbi:MAG: NAD-dependent epimerase/dehydratase family protein [Acidobacteriota bacterium]|nr:NAD-dependent epimerase/dehydratase family protein [Acidobacteriota bacterium]
MSVRWLITGSQGFVGRYAAAYIMRSDPSATVVGVGRSDALPNCFSHTISTQRRKMQAPLPASMQKDFGPQYRYWRADLQNTEETRSAFRDLRPNIVLHLASGLRGDQRIDLLRTNIEGTAILIEAAAANAPEIPIVVMASSGGVYGSVTDYHLPLNESQPCLPDDEYSVSKLAAEHLGRVLARKHSIRLIIARIFNAIGAGQNERHLGGKLAAHVTELRRNGGGELRLGNLSPSRDFIDVLDVARAMVTLARKRDTEGIFNVCSGIETSVRELVQRFCEVAQVNPRMISDVELEAGVSRNCGSIDRLLRFGFRPEISLDRSIRQLLEYYDALYPYAVKIGPKPSVT